MADPTSLPMSSPSPSENWMGIVRSRRPSAIFAPFADIVILPPFPMPPPS
jgi:hypothetical protein